MGVPDWERVSQRTAEGFRQFVYQRPDMLALQMERDESEETVAQYTMGAGLEAMHRDGASSFYHYNHLGTALALTGANEAVTDTYRHDAWGVLLESTGGTINPHTYVGRERYYRMPEAEMYHLGFRDYAQGIGRFMTVDPARDGTNWYSYVGNGPTTAVDPRGWMSQRCCDMLEGLDRLVTGRAGVPWRDFCETLNNELADFLMKCLGKNLPPRIPPGPPTGPPVGEAPPPDRLPDLRGWPPYDVWYEVCHRSPIDTPIIPPEKPMPPGIDVPREPQEPEGPMKWVTVGLMSTRVTAVTRAKTFCRCIYQFGFSRAASYPTTAPGWGCWRACPPSIRVPEHLIN